MGFRYPICVHIWDFWVAQLVKNLPEIQETLVQFLVQEGPLQKE